MGRTLLISELDACILLADMVTLGKVPGDESILERLVQFLQDGGYGTIGEVPAWQEHMKVHAPEQWEKYLLALEAQSLFADEEEDDSE